MDRTNELKEVALSNMREMDKYANLRVLRELYEESAAIDKHRLPEASRIHAQEHRHILDLLDKAVEEEVRAVTRAYWRFYLDDLESRTSCRECSNCKDKRYTPYADNYCPSCGAIMNMPYPETEKILEEI